VLYATAVGHRAYEYTEKHQGYFSWAIAQALSGGAANVKGEVTLRALVKYLEDNVPKLVALDYGTKVEQKPFAEIEGFRADELVLSLATATGAVTSTRPGPVGAPAEIARGTGTDPGPRQVNVLLSRSNIADDVFMTALVQALQRVNLNVTPEWTLDEKGRREIKTRFDVNVNADVSVKDLPAYGEMKIAVANVTLKAIDLSSGEIAAVQSFEARGFGNEQAQARSNALKEASQQIPKDFINQVVARAAAK